jgi:hypothetical protein
VIDCLPSNILNSVILFVAKELDYHVQVRDLRLINYVPFGFFFNFFNFLLYLNTNGLFSCYIYLNHVFILTRTIIPGLNGPTFKSCPRSYSYLA